MKSMKKIVKAPKTFCTLDLKLKILSDYKIGYTVQELNEKYGIKLWNLNYWVKNEKNFKRKKERNKKTMHNGAFRKINLDEKELLRLLIKKHENYQKVDTLVITRLVEKLTENDKNVTAYNIKSWIYRFIKKYYFKLPFLEKRKNKPNSYEKEFCISDMDILEYNKINNKPFYIEKVIYVARK